MRGEHEPPPQGRRLRGALRCWDGGLQPAPLLTPTLPPWGTGNQCSQCRAGEDSGILGLLAPPGSSPSFHLLFRRATNSSRSSSTFKFSQQEALPAREETPRGSQGLRGGAEGPPVCPEPPQSQPAAVPGTHQRRSGGTRRLPRASCSSAARPGLPGAGNGRGAREQPAGGDGNGTPRPGWETPGWGSGTGADPLPGVSPAASP